MADISGYHTLEAGGTTVSADNIFVQYGKGLSYLVWIVENCPDQFTTELAKIFPNDPYCQCQLGMRPRSAVSCVHCSQIRRLMDYRYMAPNTEFVVANGRYVGKKLLVVEDEKVSCKAVVQDQVVILDRFTLANVIHCYLYQKLLTVGFHTILPCYTAFTCATSGYRLVRSSEPLSAVLLDDMACQQALKQIATTLDYLTHVNFHRRELCANDWRVIQQPVAYKYKGVCVNASFRVVLANFTDCTVRVGQRWFVDQQTIIKKGQRPLSQVNEQTFRLTPSTADDFHCQREQGQWNNGSYLWCSYLQCLWEQLACCTRLDELQALFPSGTNSCYHQDLSQTALPSTLEKMALW